MLKNTNKNAKYKHIGKPLNKTMQNICNIVESTENPKLNKKIEQFMQKYNIPTLKIEITWKFKNTLKTKKSDEGCHSLNNKPKK